MTPSVTVDMDVGGTFTDGFFTLGDRSLGVKVDTTPHDLTSCFWSCLEAGAEQLGFADLGSILAETSVIRFSTTVGTNTILQGTGPRVGLMVSAGEEERLYAPAGSTSSLAGRFVPRELILGVPFGADGVPDEATVRDGLKRLLSEGARHVVVSLADAGRDNTQERAVAAIVRRYFPRHFLGSVPLLLSSDVRPRLDDFTRTNVAVLNAYLHRDLANSLYRADDHLRLEGYARPLLVTHSSGGAARVAKTRAVDTYNSGPVAGLFGSAYFSRRYGLPRAVTVDVGGTSTDIGVVVDGAPRYRFRSSIADLPVDLPSYETNSIAAGGGSIARPAPNGAVTVGPDSAGAIPGPAAYALGGTRPTVTDAYLVLDYLDAGYFLGGRRRLDRAAAERALSDHLAAPLGIDVEEAALRVVDELVRLIANAVRLAAGAAEAALFAFGGGGGLLAARLGDGLGMDAYLFNHGAVLNAFGSSQMDVVHTYERSLDVALGREIAPLLLRLLADLEDRARRDMRGEGFDDASIDYLLELEVEGLVRGGTGIIQQSFAASWEGTLQHAVTAALPGDRLVAVRVRASVAVPHAQVAKAPAMAGAVDAALRGRRAIVLRDGRVEVPVYDRHRLGGGQTINGPALVEGSDTTILVPGGHRLEVDVLGNAVIRRPPPAVAGANDLAAAQRIRA